MPVTPLCFKKEDVKGQGSLEHLEEQVGASLSWKDCLSWPLMFPVNILCCL